jgi:sugar phosphate isomerase/epimerase
MLERKFTLSLNPFAIGVRADQKSLVEMAHRHGYEAISAIPDQLAAMPDDELQQLLAEMEQKKLVWGSAGLPVDFRKDQDRFQSHLDRLPEQCAALQKAGVRRVGTWIMPTHPDLTYLANFRQHASRLRQAATILGDFGLHLGLEYVGPQTLMTSQRFPFLHTMAETRDLIEAIGLDNVGFQLDSFHWYCSGETEEDLLSLSNRDVVVVDLNDARAGYTREAQIDGKRELPSSTGVIDLRLFLGALAKIGYDGPIRSEPFNQELRDMEDEAALKANYQALRRSFDLISTGSGTGG